MCLHSTVGSKSDWLYNISGPNLCANHACVWWPHTKFLRFRTSEVPVTVQIVITLNPGYY